MKKIISVFAILTLSITQIFAYPDKLVPIGQTVGIKIMSDGVIISGITQIETVDGPRYPAKDAKMLQGDIIKEINGEKITTNEQVLEKLSQIGGKISTFLIDRDGEILTLEVTPMLEAHSNEYKIGIWVRDSMAGIGTVTYLDPETGDFGALGHSISEQSSGKLMPILNGEIVPSYIVDVQKGEKGAPGQLNGEFKASENIGFIELNSEQGMFGNVANEYFSKEQSLDVAQFSDIKIGEAYILSNVYGSNVDMYSIEITSTDIDGDKNFAIKITDPRLIDITGGIVQGMSGSPIIQDGKIIGAVTHVLVNDPTMGYGIFIENMLDTAESIG